MKTKNRRNGKTYHAAGSSQNKALKRSKAVNKPQEQPARENDSIQGEAERRELNTPLWAVNLEREHEE